MERQARQTKAVTRFYSETLRSAANYGSLGAQVVRSLARPTIFPTHENQLNGFDTSCPKGPAQAGHWTNAM